MKYLSKISMMLLLVMLFSYSENAIAGGPGFKDDVKTWGDDDNGDNDDQCEQDDSGDDEYQDDDSNEIPLDGGLSFLAIAGGAYGVKRIRDNRKK